MVTKEDLFFRQVVTLRDGARVLLRPLVPDDRQALVDFFVPVPMDERRYMRHNINDPLVVASWAENPNYEHVFPLVAVIGDRIVGNGTLHFGEGHSRHRAEMRIFLAKDFRRRGLGNKLIQALIEQARKRSLYLLEVQIISDHVDVIKAMSKAGFETVCTFEDYFLLPDGELRDVVHMILHLRTVTDEF
ncbi:MAG TPA: GNAT family N-acetyltransferase [Anaerolineales bacterium]|nr:GNAT family N-acetyltransferase [Anaerolineales bacterium]